MRDDREETCIIAEKRRIYGRSRERRREVHVRSDVSMMKRMPGERGSRGRQEGSGGAERVRLRRDGH